MTGFSYRHLTPEEAEDELTGACLRHKEALEATMVRLWGFPYECIRCPENRAIIGAVLVLYKRGEQADEERLARIMAKADKRFRRDAEWWARYLDALWVPWPAVPGYVEGLLDALCEHYEAQGALYEATKRVEYANPFKRAAEAVKPSTPHKGGIGL